MVWETSSPFIFWQQLVTFLRRQWHPTPVLLPGKSHGWRSLVGCSPWGRYESDTTEQLHFHFSLSHNGEGNGNPLQCPCLENPRDSRAWWAAVYGVAQSRTQLKRLSSSSSRAHTRPENPHLYHIVRCYPCSVFRIMDGELSVQSPFSSDLFKAFTYPDNYHLCL